MNTSESGTPRQRLIAKIKALLSKTVERGCTENEALAALAKAKELMEQYAIDDTDLTFGGEPFEVNSERKDDRYDIRAHLCTAVGAFCTCTAFKNGIERVAFAGLYSDTVFAHWLLDMLHAFVERELRNYLEANPMRQRVRRIESKAFVQGCTERIAERLYALAPPSTAMILKKQEVTAATMAAAGIRLRQPFKLYKVGDAGADLAGIRAGERANFDKPLNAGESQKAIT
jgi:hypothetical protein